MGEKKSALLVIDLQEGPLYGTYKRDEIISVIQNMITRAEENQIPIIYVQHEEAAGSFLERGTPFWQFTKGISPKPSDIIIHKKSTDSFFDTTLKQELDNLGITNLIVVGAKTEYCVDTTCRSAVTQGFNVTLVADAHTTGEGVIAADLIIQHHNQNLNSVKTVDHHISVITSENVRF
ncbi:isochorismatase family protein [Bacillus sp. BRMEA1]|uniref:isochorismatase family protein n=1 Tax=Neobacillus endophyticus TaxID=2738405 RepID=UPI001565617A|nr:isochorismatase family protein [Neobacillus endophyticus]NRD79516.1 isochorismatase family protein [Neobacillus endophyticus]